MSNIKKLFNTFVLSFTVVGMLLMGIFILPHSLSSHAEPPTYQEVENSTPDYFSSSSTDTAGNVANEIFLMQGGESGSFINTLIGDGLIENTGTLSNPENDSEYNYAYVIDEDTYYYFNFPNNLALYYNLTNTQLQAGEVGQNLMDNQSLSNYVYSHDNAFSITSLGITPQRLDINFYLDTVSGNDSPQFSGNNIILNQEGIYTLVINVRYFYTTNGGITYDRGIETVYYTFMVFNSDTYFNDLGLPNLNTSTNIQTSSLSSTDTFSTYYFYNYSYAGDSTLYNYSDLATISYNPNLYQITVDYVDINDNTFTSTIVYQNGNVTQVDENGEQIAEEDYFLCTNFDGEDLSLIFLDLGRYDISLQYLYKSTTSGQEETYELDLSNLENSNLQNKSQRLYIYGYQAVYSDYSNIDSQTNQPQNVELKSYDLDNKVYEESADITSAVNNYLKENPDILDDSESETDATTVNPLNYIDYKNISAPFSFDNLKLETMILEYLNNGDNGEHVTPVSTNQTPIKFLTNASAVVSDSFIYSLVDNGSEYSFSYLDRNGDEEFTSDEIVRTNFEGFNQNEAGLYLYVIQYRYDSYLSESGSLQSSYYHYQIFFFEVTNTIPTVTVYNDDLDEVYTTEYTNQGVYILNDSQSNIFDADVQILLSAYDYQNRRYFFEAQDITTLSQYNMAYRYFDYATEESENYLEFNEKIGGHYGIYIGNDNNYANARFTIQIISANTSTPSTRSFTIDTSEISGIEARGVTFSSNTTYRIGQTLSSYNSNQPLVFSWNEKASGAVTYGYLKYIPIAEINYYSSQTSQSSLTQLLSRWINDYNVLPVSYKIDLENSSAWTEYRNSYSYTSTIESTYVRSNSGFYILEIYDEAGNSSFEIFLIDDTSPVFVLRVQLNSTTRSIMQNNMSILVPEDNTRMYVEWAGGKAIYLDNVDSYNQITPYTFTSDISSASELLQQTLSSFFDYHENSDILNVTDIGISTSPSNVDTGISSYNGSYLVIDLDDTTYIRNTDGDYLSYNDITSYEIDFIDESTNEAIEGTYRILLRDLSNTITSSDEQSNFLNNPSAFISFNVTSDESRLSVIRGEEEILTYAGFDQNGNLYYYEEEGDRVYTHLPTANIDGEDVDLTQSDLTYKFSYYTPTDAEETLTISFIPVSENGSRLDYVLLRYYPYEKVSLDIDSDLDGVDDLTYYYYDISEDYQDLIYLYQYSQNEIYEAGQEVTFELALGSGNLPLAGRYEIVRQYVEGNETGQYDYFRRTITFDVDDYELISPLETVTNTNGDSSLESIVGGDIILSLYSGEGNSSIQISYPSFSEDGLNSGSFYTQEEFTNEFENPRISISGNKLPMTLYIPKYKYTTYYEYDEATNSYSVNYNNNLSYYGNSEVREETGGFYVYSQGVAISGPYSTLNEALSYLNQNASIEEYEIKVKVEANLGNETRYYYSNGSEENGYLLLYEGNADGVISDASNPVRYFYRQGSYVVTIYQSANDPQNSFYSFYKFGFEIISQEPEFDVLTADGYALDEVSDGVYYTNSNELTIQWEVPTSQFEAKINEDFDYITINGSRAVDRSDIVSNGNTRSFTVDCSNLIEVNGSSLQITMEYEGHNDSYYNRTTKTIYFDRSAPLANLENLMTDTENATGLFSVNYQQIYMRSYQNYLGQDVDITASNLSEVANMSYSYTINAGNFRYYSYVVSTDFFSALASSLSNSSRFETQYIYYREVPSLDSYSQVDRNSFSEGSYYSLTTAGVQDIRCSYYEIVERDYAGNMTVYLVYVNNSTYEDDENVSDLALAYENSRREGEIYTSEIYDGYNIYSNGEFELRDVNYMSDPWSTFYVQIAGQSSVRYMISPWLEDGYAYRISVSASEITFTQVSLSSIFASVESSASKHVLTLTDRLNGRAVTTYLSIMDTDDIEVTPVSDPNRTSLIVNISVPTESQYQSTTTTYLFPVNIQIFMFDSINGYIQIMEAYQSPYGTWNATEDYQEALENISFTHINNGSTLQIRIYLGANASQKIRFVIEDNFGNTTTNVQIANEFIFDDVTSTSNLYTITESNGDTTYLAESDLTFSYNILLHSIIIYDREGQDVTLSFDATTTANNILSYTFTPTTTNVWDDYYRIVLSDSDTGEQLDTIHLRLYSQLPYLAYSTNEINSGGIVFIDSSLNPLTRLDYAQSQMTVHFNGVPYTAMGYTATTYSRNIRVRFRDGQTLNSEGSSHYLDGYGYSVYLSADNGATWTNINSNFSASSGYTVSGTGSYLFLVIYDTDEVFTDLCRIYQINILDSSSSYYYITVDGTPIESGDMAYTDESGREYHTSYIVSVEYADRDNRMQIVVNEELDVVLSQPTVINTGTNVVVETYHYECSESSGDFAIIYIGEPDSIVSLFTYESNNGDETPIETNSTSVLVVDIDNNNNNNQYDRLKLNFTSYYGIEQNLINVQVLRYFNGEYVEITPQIYRNGNQSYIYLDKAGSYRVMLYDSCSPANIQTFRGNNYIEIIFLNTVPFIVTYTDTISGEQIVSERVDNAVYNGNVTLSLYNLDYYNGTGYPRISVTRNGFDYTNFTTSNYTYTFQEPGYYSVTFTASVDGTRNIRQITYNFTILNENESRNAFSYSEYSNYYIESVIKDGIDITQDLIDIGNFSTVRINGQTYLASISLNYLDNKTGAGRYRITINTNDNAYAGSSSESFTFEFWINSQIPPLNISLDEGQSTTGTITITFNVQNLYNAMGDCYIRVGSSYYYFTADRLSNYGETYTITIDQTGTYFIQLYNMSNNLLFSYKVTRDEPLNTFAIMAIVIAVIVAIAIVVITILIRRKQRVK